MTTELSPISSRLAQSGSDAEPFHLDSLSIREIKPFTAVRIRALPGFDQGKLTDTDLPTFTGTCHGTNPATLCLRPSEWLRLGTPGHEESPRFKSGTISSGFKQWNETDGLGILRIKGEAAAWLLCKNSSLDFLVDSDTPNHCVQCKMGRVGVLVYFHRDQDNSGQFDLVVERSLVNYLWQLMVSSAPHAAELHAQFKSVRGRERS